MSTSSFLVSVALASFWVVGTSAGADDVDKRFSDFHLGDRCSVIAAAMGDPTAQSASLTLGVAHSRFRWVAGSRTYIAVCVADRLVSKRLCQSMPDC
jgi:hypothetical protein